MSDLTDFLDPARERFREALAKSIAQSERGRLRMKLKNFLEGFGYAASARVRQSSLASALESLRSWGYEHKLSGSGVNDYITMWKSDAPTSVKERSPEGADRSKSGVITWKDGVLDLSVEPLTFGFHVDDAATREQSAALWHDITAAI